MFYQIFPVLLNKRRKSKKGRGEITNNICSLLRRLSKCGGDEGNNKAKL